MMEGLHGHDRLDAGGTGAGVKKQTRTRTGCLNCRRKKRKCDEGRPVCGTCRRRSEHCEWGLKISFRVENAQGIDSTHPSMRRMARTRPPREFEIMDVTSEVIQDYHQPLSWAESDNEADTRINYKTYYTERARGHSGNGSRRARQELDTHQIASEVVSPSSQLQTESAVANLIYLSQGGPPQSSSLNSEMRLPDSSLHMDFVADYSFMDQSQDMPPDQVLETHTLIPGSAFHDLHSIVRDRLIRKPSPTREATSQLNAEWGQDGMEVDRSLQNVDAANKLLTRGSHSLLPSGDIVCHLWKNWFNEVAPWLDKFDNNQTFRTTLPSMARDHSYLRYSILALSARHLELTGSPLSAGYSLALYQEAIRQLLPHIPEYITAVTATCVTLCLMEFLNNPSDSWESNIDGVASMMDACGLDGFSDGTEEGLFWCFARMEISSELASSTRTLFSTTRWAYGTDLETATRRLKIANDFMLWSKYAIRLLASADDLVTPAKTETLQTSARNDPSFRRRWLDIWKHICEWYQDRPAQVLPVMTIPSSDKSPFPTILFSNSAAVSATQLHHTASILMLQNQPSAVQLNPRPRSILWHARQICGISISNEDHAAWLDGVQPLFIAGKCMSHPSEHKAILELLEKIQRSSGWKTQSTAQALKDFWGDLGD